MKMVKQQNGLTLIGFLMVLSLVVFFGYISLKLFPIYQEYYSVVQAMKQVQNQPGIGAKSPKEIKDNLFNRLYVSYVKSVTRDKVKILRKGGLKLQVKYEVREPLIFNLDVVAVFDETVDLTGR